MKEFPRFGIATTKSLLSFSSDERIKINGEPRINQNTFDNGGFVCIDLENSRAIANELTALSEYTPLFNNRRFAVAYIKVYKKIAFNPRLFLKKMKTRNSMLERKNSANQYIDAIESIYNYRNKVKVILRY